MPFEIKEIEQIKGIRAVAQARQRFWRAAAKAILALSDNDADLPIIENTAHEEDLRDTLEGAIGWSGQRFALCW